MVQVLRSPAWMDARQAADGGVRALPRFPKPQQQGGDSRCRFFKNGDRVLDGISILRGGFKTSISARTYPSRCQIFKVNESADTHATLADGDALMGKLLVIE